MTLGLQRGQGRFACKTSIKFLANVANRCGIVELVLGWAEKKAESDAAKRIEAKKKTRIARCQRCRYGKITGMHIDFTSR